MLVNTLCLQSVVIYLSYKKYGTDIVITDPPPGIRTGMTANVTILSEQIKDAIQIPLTAVYRLDGNVYIASLENEKMSLIYENQTRATQFDHDGCD